jgi:hypothetical protein
MYCYDGPEEAAMRQLPRFTSLGCVLLAISWVSVAVITWQLIATGNEWLKLVAGALYFGFLGLASSAVTRVPRSQP